MLSDTIALGAVVLLLYLGFMYVYAGLNYDTIPACPSTDTLGMCWGDSSAASR